MIRTDNLKPDVKKKWLKALRSRKYQQGVGWLRDEKNQFCCIGVLCDTLKLKWEKHPHRDVFMAHDEHDQDPARTRAMPKKTRKAIGLSPETEMELMDLNDAERSFEEIADWIEKHL